jgi:purine-binding chemotaxis protein CheW
MADVKDIVEFEIGSGLYGMDISLVREIVEMLPITRLPGSQNCIVGVINLRGEVTMVISISELLNIKGESERKNEKIIVMVPDLTRGSNIGIIVREVHSVLSVPVEDIEPFSGILATDSGGFVKGIIKTSSGDKDRLEETGKNSRLLLYLDIEKILKDLKLPCNIK